MLDLFAMLDNALIWGCIEFITNNIYWFLPIHSHSNLVIVRINLWLNFSLYLNDIFFISFQQLQFSSCLIGLGTSSHSPTSEQGLTYPYKIKFEWFNCVFPFKVLLIVPHTFFETYLLCYWLHFSYSKIYCTLGN